MKPCVPLEKHCSCVPLMAVNDTFVTVSGKICVILQLNGHMQGQTHRRYKASAIENRFSFILHSWSSQRSVFLGFVFLDWLLNYKLQF